jgi:hypothetical protein
MNKRTKLLIFSAPDHAPHRSMDGSGQYALVLAIRLLEFQIGQSLRRYIDYSLGGSGKNVLK